MNGIERFIYGIGDMLCCWAERRKGDRVAFLVTVGKKRHGMGVLLESSDLALNARMVRALYDSAVFCLRDQRRVA